MDLKRLPPKVVQQVRGLLDGTFLDRCENVLVFGNPGSGKTHILSAISQELIRSGRRVYFRDCGLMIVSFRQACKIRPPRAGLGRRPMGVRVANGSARSGYGSLVG